MPEKYESLKPITIKALKNAGACEDKLQVFTRSIVGMDYKYAYDEIEPEVAMKVASDLGYPRWLIDKGFVREKKRDTCDLDKINLDIHGDHVHVRYGQRCLLVIRASGVILNDNSDAPRDTCLPLDERGRIRVAWE